MKTNVTQLAQAIRHIYNTMNHLSHEVKLNGRLVNISTGRKLTDPILIMVENENGEHIWFKASKNASHTNNLYNISEKAAQVIA